MSEVTLCPDCVAIFVQRNEPEYFCPFCGAETVTRNTEPHGQYAGVWVRCSNCENGWEDATNRLGSILDGRGDNND